MSQITTHVLDTATGKPAAGIHISLQRTNGKDVWETIADGRTNADGRLASLLTSDKPLASGTYRLVFETREYFERQNVRSFYPFVPVVFEISDDKYYHVPLLLSPHGYSTYRGS